MTESRHSVPTVTRLTAHIVWVTKYRYHVLQGTSKQRCCDLLGQIGEAEEVCILKGVVSPEHVHMLVEYPPGRALSDLGTRMKGRTSRLLQQEYLELGKRYWGKHFWAISHTYS